MVRDRTRELEQALEAVATSNRELNEAAVVSMTTQNRLQDAIDSISEGLRDLRSGRPADPVQPALHRFLARPRRRDAHRPHASRASSGSRSSAAASPRRTGRAPMTWIADRMRQRESTRRHGADRWVYAQSGGRWVQVNDRRVDRRRLGLDLHRHHRRQGRGAPGARARAWPSARCICRRRWRACRSASRCSTGTSAW